MVNIFSSYGITIIIVISILISFIDGKYISNETEDKWNCSVELEPDKYVDFACKLFYFYLKINFNNTNALLNDNTNNTFNNITSISYNSQDSIKITFNSQDQNDEYIIVNIPNHISIKKYPTTNQLYLRLNITDNTSHDIKNKPFLLINLTAFRNNSLIKSNNTSFTLNIKNNEFFYIRKFSFRYTFSFKSGFFGNLFILLGAFIALRGYPRINISLILMTICCFQITIEDFIELFPNAISFDDVYVTFAIISSIIFGLFAGIFMAYKNYFMFAYYTCLFSMIYKYVFFLCMNILNTFPKHMEWLNLIITSIGSIVVGYILSLTKLGDDKYKKFISVLTTSLFGVELIITGMTLMIQYVDYDRYLYEKQTVKDGVVDKICLIAFVVPLGLQYVGVYLINSAKASSTLEQSVRSSQGIRNVINNMEESTLFPGRDTEGNDGDSENDRYSARITQVPSRNSEYSNKETYGVDNDYIIASEGSFDGNDE